jgi:hypothetical protein
MNQIPGWPCVSVSLNALTDKLPIRFRVNMPVGADRGSWVIITGAVGLMSGPWLPPFGAY